MKLPSLQRNFLYLTMALVVILGSSAVYSLLKRPSKIDAGLANKVADANISSGRQPSSIQSQPSTDNTKTSSESVSPAWGKSLSMTIGCEHQNSESVQNLGATQGAHLRLLGSPCEREVPGSLDISVRNLSNGFTAQVIELRERGYTTDYIDLAEGENQLVVTRKDESGQVTEQKIRISRLPASEPTPVDN